MPNENRERLVELIDKAGITHFIAHYNDVPNVINTLADYLLKNCVEPVVRCKDCEYAKAVIHRGEEMPDIFKCTYLKPKTTLFGIDFCRYGIPRERSEPHE